MEDNNILLMRVLKIHYKDRLEILDGALQVIKEYSNKPMSNQNEYDTTTLTLKNMLNDLPDEIVTYFLTMMPLPKNKENIPERKDQNSNIKDVLLKYLKEEIPPLIPIVKPEIKIIKPPVIKDNTEGKIILPTTVSIIVEQPTIVKSNITAVKRPIIKPKRKGPNRPTDCKKLLDICAEYVVQNQQTLSLDYQALNTKVWKMVNSNKFEGEALQKLYDVLRDLNKKIKWMRLLDADDISEEIIREEYGRSNIFIKERHLDEVLKEDPFVIKDELRNAIRNFVIRK